MKNRAQNILTLLLLAAFITGTIFSGSASIFCIANDGHVELEPIYSDCCAEETHAESSTDFHDDADGCSDCSDIEVSNHLWSKRNNSEKLNHINKLYSITTPDISYSQSILQQIHSVNSHKYPSTENKAHISISSTVIFC
ncbi:MAG: hypothetical protein DWP97_01540 [Calditrichaeota bacterium]|nr:MAG: hypothetical protein DWP97_01540 [Calditrichota bacterium]